MHAAAMNGVCIGGIGGIVLKISMGGFEPSVP